MNKVTIIDYGMGNLHSVAKAVEFAARELQRPVQVQITAAPAAVAAADRVILPGVGAIRDCMAEIQRLKVGEMVAEAVQSKPVLAICVGMQALLQHSEENGGVPCLGLLDGEVKSFSHDLQDEQGRRLKVPHIGWSRVHQRRPHPLWRGIEDGARFYFVHSYYARNDAPDSDSPSSDAPDITAAVTDYGIPFASALSQGNLFATQFHPEKSQNAGLTLLRNFLQWNGEV